MLLATRSDAPAANNSALPPLAVLYFGDAAAPLVAELQRCYPQSELVQDDAGLTGLAQAVLATLQDPAAAHRVPLVLAGTAFQQKVWQALCRIPAGSTLSYSELATQLGQAKAVRAVASANGANEISLLVPCHRLIGKSGALTGYRWGLARKQALLALEAQASQRLRTSGA
ncbi:methylated-DNA--[protein]-cysteine S-methyltransferase [Comamonas sp. J-3]|uniref:methylated-DNA--[protein]-cysteine S-methyltransferase n=1 Tax=Comamonas trifloxystrobinivorans TaxID=3350256 RepID=UPI00372CFE98